MDSLNESLINAAKDGDLENVKYLIELSGVNKNMALIISARNRHLEIVKYLIEVVGVDIHANHDDALRSSVINRDLEMIKYLIKNGADIYINHDEVLIYSLQMAYFEISEYLLKMGSGIYAKNNKKIDFEFLINLNKNKKIKYIEKINQYPEQYNYINNLSRESQNNIIMYTSSKYIEINTYLENNKLPNNKMLNKIIYNIDNLFENAPLLKENIIVFRRLVLPKIYDSRRKKNITLAGYKGLYKGFISTTLVDISNEINNTVLQVDIPKNSKCLFIEFISKYSGEQEVLINRNSILSIISFERDNLIKTKLI